ncbi:hypothetical protein M3Y95_00889400 [Aphelenchoides besseyi]|nr:hypothetical protein M3Y95_00889400 [Aphelenchoides besseyi]
MSAFNSSLKRPVLDNVDEYVGNPTFELILSINNFMALTLGFISTVVLFYMIKKKSPPILQQYRPMLLVSLYVDVYMLISAGFCRTRSQYHNGVYVYVFTGFANLLPPIAQWAVLSLPLTSPSLEILIIPIEFFVRYRIIKNRTAPSIRKLSFYVGIAIVLVIIEALFIIPDYLFYIKTDVDYSVYWTKMQPAPSYVLATYLKQNISATICVVYRLSLTIGAFGMTIIVVLMTVRSMNEQVAQMSDKTKEMLSQYGVTCIAKTILPALTNFIPVFSLFLSTVSKQDTPILRPINAIIFIWSPVISSLSTLLLIGSYRRTLIRIVCCTSSSVEQKSKASQQPPSSLTPVI